MGAPWSGAHDRPVERVNAWRPRYTPGARRRPEAKQFASGHLDRRAPRFRIGPECATQTVAARRCRRFRRGRANAAAQRNFTAARAESLNYFGERTIGLPFVEATAASRRRRIAARQFGPALSSRQHPKHGIDYCARFHAWSTTTFAPCWLRTEQRLDQRPLVVSQIVEQHHVSPQ